MGNLNTWISSENEESVLPMNEIYIPNEIVISLHKYDQNVNDQLKIAEKNKYINQKNIHEVTEDKKIQLVRQITPPLIINMAKLDRYELFYEFINKNFQLQSESKSKIRVKTFNKLYKNSTYFNKDINTLIILNMIIAQLIHL